VRRLQFLFLVVLGCAPLAAQTPATHTVGAGETIYAIAKKYGTTTEAILQANPGLNPARIHAGEKIRLPSSSSGSAPDKTVSSSTSSAGALPPSTSSLTPTASSAAPKTWLKVQKGDTLSKIARENGVKLEDLRKWNGLSADTIRPGELLRIRAPVPTSTTRTAAATPSAPPKPAPTAPKKPVAPEWRFINPVRTQIEGPKDRLRDWEYIVVHHSGTSGGNAKIFDYYHAEERGMENGMAYHFVIGNGTDSGDGQIEVGNRWRRQIQGGHLASETLNEIAIGICLVGDFSRSRLGPRQTASLIELVQYLRKMMPDQRLKFRTHREINTRPTECPGRLFPTQALREILNQPVTGL
jgi:LysM repeat protein